MQNYNLTPDNIDDINTRKCDFFSLLLEQSESYINLDILSESDINTSEKIFWKKFIENHEEIRKDIKLTRYFILKKKDKLVKELKGSLFMSNIYDNLTEESKNEYWKFVHSIFLLLETAHVEKNDAIINTLTSELEKLLTLEKIEEKVEEKEKNVNRRKNIKKNNLNMNNLDISKIGEMMQGLLNGSENIEDLDMNKMLNTLMPGLESKKNSVLMSNLMDDITKTMSNLESTDQVLDVTKELGEKYQKMIVSGEIDATEIVGSLMGLVTDKKFTNELSKLDMSKINPEDMITKMMGKMSPDILEQLNGSNNNLDLTNIGSLISGVTGMVNTKPNEKKEDKDLTPEQIKEMEDYFSKLKIETNVD